MITEQNEKRKRKRGKKKKKKEENYRRAGSLAEGYEGAGQGHIFPDTTSSGASSQVSFRGLPKREREFNLILIRRQKG